MRAGIEKSGCFLLFLSKGVLQRPFVQVCGAERAWFLVH